MMPNKIRRDILDMIMELGEGHPGGSFSCVEILISLYDKILTEDDIFIMSKGHACQALYAVLREKGYNPKLSGHPDIDIENGIACTTGSLGHGLPVGIGMAMAKKYKREEGNIYVLMSDGELQEGTTWESFMIAAHHKLDNLCVIIDLNGIQALDRIDNILKIPRLEKKLDNFGLFSIWVDGHNLSELEDSFELTIYKNIPRVIVAQTIKGKGISFMERDPKWHARLPTKEEYELALRELSV